MGYSSIGTGVSTDAKGSATTAGGGNVLPSLGGFSATPPSTQKASDQAYSTTVSGVSAGALTITDSEGQQALTGKTAEQSVAELNREVETGKDSANALSPIFDQERVQANIQA